MSANSSRNGNLSTASPESSIIPLATGAEPAPPQGTTSPTFNKRLGCALPSCTPYLIPGSFGLLTICSTDQSTRARTPSHPYVQGPIKELLTYRIPTYAPFSKLCVRCVRTDCADPEPGMDAHDFGCIWARAPNRHVQFHCFFCFLKRYWTLLGTPKFSIRALLLRTGHGYEHLIFLVLSLLSQIWLGRKTSSTRTRSYPRKAPSWDH